jgi:hypothetical protein
MAYTSGEAANFTNLLEIMVSYAAANGWAILEQTPTKVYLRGEGLNGLDEIYVGVETYADAGNNQYNWKLVGSWGWRPGRALKDQPNSSYYPVAITGQDGYTYAYLCNSPMNYWLSVTKRRILLIVNANGYFNTIHLGFLTPPATEAQYPYPLLIGGSGSTLPRTWGNTYNAAFWGRTAHVTLPGPSYVSSMSLSIPGGAWAKGWTYPYEYDNAPMIRPCHASYDDAPYLLTALDGTYMLEQIYITSTGNLHAIYGAVEGLFYVSAHLGNIPENIITVEGVNYIVTQDVSRSGYGNLCCMRMD